MIRINGRVRGVGALAVLLAVGGCVSHKAQQQQNASLKGEGADTAGVTVSAPTLSYDGGLLLIQGTVHADAAGPDIDGRLDYELIGATGEAVMHANGGLLRTKMVPGDPSRNEPYETRWDIHPTPEQTVRVHFVDRVTAFQEDAKNTGSPGTH